MNLKSELDLAIKLGREAGEEVYRIYRSKNFQIEIKEDETPMTTADEIANNIIISGLKDFNKNANLNYAILSEESNDDGSRLNNDWCWIIDPIDGTKEFIERTDEFTINIALIYKERPVVGVTYIPVTGEIYYASLDKGAYYQQTEGKLPIRIDVSDRDYNLIAVRSRMNYTEKLISLLEANSRIKDIRVVGSALKGCLVAKGDADIYYRFLPNKEWDTAAIDCLVTEAGGYFRDLKTDQPLKYNRKDVVNRNGLYVVNQLENIIH